jgi:hypothetical protein
MSITLDELLLLVGRLDDAPGFDTPRERFRRFLFERVTDVPTARALIEECQRSVGEQRHRALQDLVVLVGRLLRFEITFGGYERSADGVRVDGQWRSPGLLAVALEIRTEQTRATTLDGLARAVSAMPPRADSESPIGLCVVARQYAPRDRLGHMLAADTLLRDLRMVSVQSLLSLAALVAADRVSHGEVVKLLRSGFALDFVIDLLDRPATNSPSTESTAAFAHAVDADHHEPSFWVATIIGNETAAPDRLFRSVIAQRRLLAICHAGRFRAEGSPGDWVCFFIPGKGIVGHAQLISVIEDSASVIRHANRFSRVYRLADVTLYEQPVVQALRAERPFAVPPVDVPLAGACLAPIAKHDFVSLTTYREGTPTTERPRSATA